MRRFRTKYIFLLGTICALTLNQNAFAIGIGTSVKSESYPGRTIYLPIKTQGSIFIEPFISRNKSESKDAFGDTFTETQQTIGVGFFTINKIEENLSRYMGARIAQTTRKRDNFSGSGTDKLTIKSITPIIGLDYSINKNVSIALEAGITIYDGKYEDGFDSTSYSDLSGNDTFTQLMARYYF